MSGHVNFNLFINGCHVMPMPYCCPPPMMPMMPFGFGFMRPEFFIGMGLGNALGNSVSGLINKLV